MRLLAALFILVPAACRDDRPPAPTAEESARLDQAEQMLNEEGPEASAPDPSNRSD